MSTRFVAPPPASRTSFSSATEYPEAKSPDKNGRLPPPLHPALAGRRIVSPGPGYSGALNGSPALLGSSPAPEIPQRPSYYTSSSSDAHHPIPDSLSPSGALSPRAQSALPQDLESTALSSGTSLSSGGDPPTPILLVTPAAGSTAEDLHAPWKSDILPPYASLPDLTDPPYQSSSQPSDDHSELFRPDTPASTRPAATTLNTAHQLPPPVHPSRQPSPSSSLVDLSSTLRHRAPSNGSSRVFEPGAVNPPPRLERTRQGSTSSILTLKDANLTDEDLRNMYDAEEVERYLRLFASRVSEVTINPDHVDSNPVVRVEDDDDWVSLSSAPSVQPAAQRPSTLPPHLANPSTPFEHVAAFIYPYILQPPPPPFAPKRKFKLNKAASAASRLYIAAYPAYIPPLIYLFRLATWHDTRLSAFWCGAFWAAWLCGFLTPLLVGRVLFALLRGGTVTREEIRRKREAAREAEVLGRAIEGGIPGVGVGGSVGIWQVMKILGKSGKRKGKKAKGVVEELRKNDEAEIVDTTAGAGEGEVEDAEDWKLMLVDIAEELADLHERVKNIFLHRRPATTRTYTILLTLLFIATLFIQNTSKFITLTCGIFFWFVPPVVRLLPALPPAFADAPTDAEVAMDLIARRVARGERVIPERVSRRKRATRNATGGAGGSLGGDEAGPGSPGSSLGLTRLTSPSTASFLEGSSEDEDGDVGLVMPRAQERAREGTEVYEDKFRKGAVKAWNWIGRAKGMVDEARGLQGRSGSVYASAEQSFPAQHRSHPGMLMVSATHLSFNPLFAPSASSTPAIPSTSAVGKNTIQVDIDQLRGVKKVSPGGLVVRYARDGDVVEERFLLVVGRDEAFATLVGWGGGRWKHV